MNIETKVRARRADGQVRVAVLVGHPMRRAVAPETESAVDHHIERMQFEVAGELAAEVYMGTGIAVNPVTTIVLTGRHTGERLRVTWRDSLGHSGEAETTLP